MNVSRFATIALSLIFCALTGCSTMMMQTSKLPDGLTLKEIAKTDVGTPFAVSSKGSYAAISEGNLQLVEPTGPPRNLSQLAPGSGILLCFSPDGTTLGAALPAGDKTTLRMLNADGKVLGETTVTSRVTSMAWRSDKELLAAALELKKYSFGSTLISTLYTWDGSNAPVASKINDATVRKAVAKLPDEAFYESYKLAVSPYRDEIAYSTMKDPPLFNPYLRIVTRHLESGAEHEIGTASVGSGGPLYTPDGESLIVGDARALTRRLALPDGKEIYAWPSPGDYPALSPSGTYLFLDGRLYQDGSEIASFPRQARGAFLPDGSGIAISYMDKLYLLSGLNDKPAPPLPKDLDRVLQLRKLRSMGLITEKEYRAQKPKAAAKKERVSAP